MRWPLWRWRDHLLSPRIMITVIRGCSLANNAPPDQRGFVVSEKVTQKKTFTTLQGIIKTVEPAFNRWKGDR